MLVREIVAPEYGENGRISITLVNTGSTPATIKAFGADLARKGIEGRWMNDFDSDAKEVSPVRLASGERHTFAAIPTVPYTENDLFESLAGNLALVILGTVRYADDNGIIRETGFSRTQADMGDRFIPSDDPTEEYAD